MRQQIFVLFLLFLGIGCRQAVESDPISFPYTLADDTKIAAIIDSAEENGSPDWQISVTCKQAQSDISLIEVAVDKGDENNTGRLEPPANGVSLSCEPGTTLLTHTAPLNDIAVGDDVEVTLTVQFESGSFVRARPFTRTESGWRLGASATSDG